MPCHHDRPRIGDRSCSSIGRFWLGRVRVRGTDRARQRGEGWTRYCSRWDAKKAVRTRNRFPARRPQVFASSTIQYHLTPSPRPRCGWKCKCLHRERHCRLQVIAARNLACRRLSPLAAQYQYRMDGLVDWVKDIVWGGRGRALCGSPLVGSECDGGISLRMGVCLRWGKGNSLLTAKEAIAHLWALQVQLQTVSNSLQSKYSDRTSLVLLKSRGLLSSWIIYCLVFDATRTNYPLVQQTKEPFTSI